MTYILNNNPVEDIHYGDMLYIIENPNGCSHSVIKIDGRFKIRVKHICDPIPNIHDVKKA